MFGVFDACSVQIQSLQIGPPTGRYEQRINGNLTGNFIFSDVYPNGTVLLPTNPGYPSITSIIR